MPQKAAVPEGSLTKAQQARLRKMFTEIVYKIGCHPTPPHDRGMPRHSTRNGPLKILLAPMKRRGSHFVAMLVFHLCL